MALATRTRPLAAALLLDALVLLVFAAIGRRSHEETGTIAGVLTTAWPFLAGAAIGHLVLLLATRRSAASLPAGITVWVCTVVGGMVLRRLTDQGTAPSFIVVATLFTSATLLGWRAIAAAISHRARQPQHR